MVSTSCAFVAALQALSCLNLAQAFVIPPTALPAVGAGESLPAQTTEQIVATPTDFVTDYEDEYDDVEELAVEEQDTPKRRLYKRLPPQAGGPPRKKKETSAKLLPWALDLSTTTLVFHPTVIGGVTFSAELPKETPNHPPPWVSLKKDGLPKTIKPKIKGAVVKNGAPDYSTYFGSVVTKTIEASDFSQQKDGKKIKYSPHEILIHEDDETDPLFEHLNPIIRCTPDRYIRTAKDRKYDENGYEVDESNWEEEATVWHPFCTPEDGSKIELGKTHFVTWYTRHFPADVKSVRLALTDIRLDADVNKNDTLHIDDAFFVSDWVPTELGWYALEIDEEWMDGAYQKFAVLSIHASDIEEHEFQLFNGPVLQLMKGPTVVKTLDPKYKHGKDKDLMTALAIPACVAVCVLLLYIFHVCTAGVRRIGPFDKLGKKSRRFRKRRNSNSGLGILGSSTSRRGHRKLSGSISPAEEIEMHNSSYAKTGRYDS